LIEDLLIELEVFPTVLYGRPAQDWHTNKLLAILPFDNLDLVSLLPGPWPIGSSYGQECPAQPLLFILKGKLNIIISIYPFETNQPGYCPHHLWRKGSNRKGYCDTN